jgi:2-oxoglutarate decarboxylase
MAAKTDPQLDVNSWLQDELREQYRHDRSSIDDEWKHLFETNGTQKPLETNGTTAAAAPNVTAASQSLQTVPRAAQTQSTELAPGEELQPLRGAAGAIAKNMNASIAIPLATSQRIIPVKVIEENRQLINHHRGLLGKSKISYTHIIGWAVVKAVQANPTLNHAFTDNSGEPCRVLRKEINLGIAVDVAAKGGGRSLMVPNINNAGSLDFALSAAAVDDLVSRARGGKLATPDFQGTTISLTNPGTVGTMASMPRLMVGQGAIIAVGAMDFPAEYRGVSPEVRSMLGISKVMSVTCTYDHRIIQGAESGAFLGILQSLLDGDKGFYEEIFSALRIPYQPVKWDAEPKGLAAGAALIAPATPKVQPAGATFDPIKEAAVIQLIHAFRVRGHLLAQLDPLGQEVTYNPELDPLSHGLSMWDLDREFYTGTLAGSQGVMTLRQILDQLRQTYCGKIACEYMHIQEPEQKQWLQQKMEPQANNWPLSRETQVKMLSRLIDAEEFEHFLHARFIGQKRFSLEGAETAIPILDAIADRAADNNVHEIVMGMAHRGRLNVLANSVGKPLGQIFSEFEGNIDPSSTQGSGDVKYHLGASGIRKTDSGREITVSLAPNPSHLEAVDPVVEGIVRPKQDRLGDSKRERVIPLLIHGDAAFAGQGVVAETLNLSQLDGYCTGGTIHLIINNQIGFTTLPDDSRSTMYSTDVARMVQAPIFHVNGDDPEAAFRVVELAYDFRQQFKKDVVIDMICYRRHGHNEGDDPAYTQPILYRKINEHPSVAVQYGERLVKDSVVSNAELTQMREAAKSRYIAAFDKLKNGGEKYQVTDLGADRAHPTTGSATLSTAVDRETIARVLDGITYFPAEFTLHPKLKGFVEKRREAFAKNGPIDWAFGEALAFGSLVLEGTPVRLSGQDSGRGTFSQRHLAFYDYEKGNRYVPLRHMSPEQGTFDVLDSSLSEYAVLGFEFGYSVADPLSLTIWEAQFGDFANGAQIMIDQFIATAEQKWGQPSGLVMLLPHGYEGQGPEHSSARMERFFVLCAQENIRMANCTTPAQYFHLLRRQARTERKPLVVFTPKSLLRHPKATSTFDDLTTGGFREVIADSDVDMSRVTRVVFCSGKVYYDLLAARDKNNAHHIALCRLEQMYPFPEQQITDVLARYPMTAEVAWVQEEPLNMGAWRFMSDWFAPLLGRRKLQYIGRAESASPASGSKKRHDQEQADIVNTALTHPIL